MNWLKSERLIDKSVDILVVVFGILTALSVDSYRETKKSEAQWTMFSQHFKADARELNKSYKEIGQFYSSQLKTATSILNKVQSGQAYKKEIRDFLPTMGMFKADYKKDTVYGALLQSSNKFLVNDVSRLNSLGEMYSFEATAMMHINVVSKHFIPDYKKFLRTYYKKNSDTKKYEEELTFLLYHYIAQVKQGQEYYKKQIAVTEKVLQVL